MRPIYLEITPFFPTDSNFKGAYVYDQVNTLRTLNDYEYIVIKCVTPYDEDRREEYVYQGIQVYQFVVYELPSSILPSLFLPINVRRLQQMIQTKITHDFSAICCMHAHVINPAGMLAYAFAKTHHIPYFIQHHGLDVFQKDNGRILKGTLRRFNYAWMTQRYIKAVQAATLNIGVSQKVLDALHQFVSKVPKKEYVLYNGVDTKKFYAKTVQKKDATFAIGCIANFWPLKDHMTLIQAFYMAKKEHAALSLHLIGSGPTKQQVIEYVNTHDLSQDVHWHDEIDHTQLNDFYNALDLFVLPSFYEALGCVYTEAMQIGIPVIGVKGQGIEELIAKEDQPHALIEQGDVHTLSSLILWHVHHQEKRHYQLDLEKFLSPFLHHIEAIL